MRGPSKFWAWAFFACYVLVFILVLVLAVAFTTGSTGMVTAMHLANPAGTPGQFFGILILWPLAVCLGFGLYWFATHVLSQLSTYADAHDLWEKVKVLQDNKPLETRSELAEKLVADLARLTPLTSRISHAAQSWNDPSPDSDAEMVIEGEANHCRQNLALLQSVASILVLIGLVGNFFGLSDAVSRMPELTVLSQQTAAPRPEAPTSSATPDAQGFHSTIKENEPDPQSTSTAAMAGESIKNIARGLQVVVVSSVLGIGGMIVLLLFVALFRAFFHHLVGEEVLLMATEIGSAVRPGQGVEGAGAELAQAANQLIDKLKTFEAKESDLTQLTDQLDGTLKLVLQTEGTRADGFRNSIDQLRSYLEGRNDDMSGILTHAATTSKNLETMARNLGEMGKSLGAMVTKQENTLSDFESYARLVKEMAEEERGTADDRYRQLVDELAGRLDGRLDQWSKKVEQERADAQKRAEDFLSQTGRTQKELVDGLSAQFKKQVEDSLQQMKEQTGAVSALLTNLLGDWKALVRDIAGELKDREKQIENVHTELVKVFAVRFASLEENLKQQLGEVARTLSERLPEAGDALRELTASVQEAFGKVNGNLQTSTSTLSQLIQEQSKTAGAHQAILEQAHRSLEQTRQGILQLQDRWNVNLELVSGELFQRWLEQYVPDQVAGNGSHDQPALALPPALTELFEGLRPLPERIDTLLGILQRAERGRVCADCGHLNPEDTGEYCGHCGKSLTHFLTRGSFPVRGLIERLEALQKSVVSRPTSDGASAPPQLPDEALRRLEEVLTRLGQELKERPPAPTHGEGADLQPLLGRLDRVATALEAASAAKPKEERPAPAPAVQVLTEQPPPGRKTSLLEWFRRRRS